MSNLPGRLLLDTHVWIWMVQNVPDRIVAHVVEEMERAAGSGGLLVSAISVWEVAMLQARGRISLSLGLDDWVRKGLTAPGVRLAELTPEILMESTRLPGLPHGDPADRMLIATARKLGTALVTRDAAILSYAREGHVSALDASP